MAKNKTYDWFVLKYEALGYPSLTQFAESIKMPKSSLSRYFNRQRQIPSNTVGKLCKALKVSPEELLKAIGAIK
jgi:DNA-binding Xre family transcriptional regulator